MSTILITGAHGFIGRNLCITLKAASHTVIPIDLQNTEQDLLNGLEKADFVIHLAGVNRSTRQEDFKKGNLDFTLSLLQKLTQLNKEIPIIVSSSTQALLDNPYGQSKKAMEDAVFSWAQGKKNKVFVYRLSNVFGKWCRPNYNSVTATFCYQISHHLPIQIDHPDKILHLIYIDDIVASFLSVIDHYQTLQTGLFEVTPAYPITLQALADKLYAFSNNTTSLMMPDLKNDFDKALYATYLSYLEPSDFKYSLTTKIDSRGNLSEFIKSHAFGQLFISTTHPGITRGNHWHHTKTEKFLVLQGEAIISLRAIEGNEVLNYNVSGEKLQVIDIPPGYTHAITNCGQTDLLTLFWASEPFNPEKPDTYYEEV